MVELTTRSNRKMPFQELVIDEEYLTFETILPTLQLEHSVVDGLPPPPDLKPFADPFKWSEARKWVTTILSTIVTAMAAYSAGAYAAPQAELMELWGVGDILYNLGISLFTIAFAVTPMILAPFSEINGRRPIFLLSGFLFMVFQICCGVTDSYGGMIASRILLGVVGSTFSTMVGGVLSDIFHTADRNTAMALFSGGTFFGTGLGPLVSGFIAKNTSWRWVFYVQAIMAAVVFLALVLGLKESRGSVLLSRKARALNKYYVELENKGVYSLVMPSDGEKPIVRRIRWKVKSDEERESLAIMLKISTTRPFYLLFTEPVVFLFSLWITFAWSILYLQFDSIPIVFSINHGFDIQQSAVVFTAMSVGGILATIIGVGQEKLAKKYHKTAHTPETRLYVACIVGTLLPIGMFWFGWTSFPSISWLVPTVAVGCATIGIYSVYLAVFNYMADVYHRYASSALAAQSFCRNFVAGWFPLIAGSMFRRLGTPGASSLLGGIAALLTVVPWILVFFGPRIRRRSKFASEIMG